MAGSLPVAEQNAILDFWSGRVDTGTTNTEGSILIYNATGTLLVDVNCNADSFAAAAAGSISLNGVPLSATAESFGATPQDASYFTIVDRDNAVKYETQAGDITATGGGGILTIDNISIAQGQTVRITSLTVGFA